MSNCLLKSSRIMICINTIGLNEWLCRFCNFNTQNWICLTVSTLHFSGLVHLTKEKVHPNLLFHMCRSVGGGQILNPSNVWERAKGIQYSNITIKVVESCELHSFAMSTSDYPVMQPRRAESSATLHWKPHHLMRLSYVCLLFQYALLQIEGLRLAKKSIIIVYCNVSILISASF